MKNLCLLALTTVFSIATAYNPGATASLNILALEHHKTFIANFILKMIEGVNVPVISFGYTDD